jgi:hypothetical protein
MNKRLCCILLSLIVIVCFIFLCSCHRRPQYNEERKQKEARSFILSSIRTYNEKGDPCSKQVAAAWSDALKVFDDNSGRPIDPSPIFGEVYMFGSIKDNKIKKHLTVMWMDSDDKVSGIYFEIGDKKYDINNIVVDEQVEFFKDTIVRPEGILIREIGSGLDKEYIYLSAEMIEQLYPDIIDINQDHVLLEDIRIGLILRNGNKTKTVPVFRGRDSFKDKE